MTEKMTLLQIPVIVDRAKDEKGKDAQKEWEKVYQVILGCDGQSAEQRLRKIAEYGQCSCDLKKWRKG